MNNEKLNTQLYEKMFEEQEKYRGWLLGQPPEEIINHTYEYTVREDILMALENNDISIEQATALLKSPTPLADVFSEFENRETGYMDIVLDCITDLANTVIQTEQEQRKALLATPLYKYPATYARKNDELPQYRASHKANIACRDAIDDAIRDNYRDNSLSSEAAKQVIAEFGFDRTLYVAANTVRQMETDGRIDYRNKDWARTVPIFEDSNTFGDDRNREFIVSRAHPGVFNLFVNDVRREYLLSLPLSKEDIQQEAARILGKLQEPREPNSPNGTHFMAQISPDFLLRAGTKEQDKLFDMLPFSSLTFSGIKDRKGLFATISKDENRNQPLRLRKPSVRDKLKQATPASKAPTKKKSKEQER